MSDHLKFYINGEWVDSLGSETIEVFNPSDESVIGSISSGTKEDVDIAVAAAKESFKTFGFSTKDERIKLLENSISAGFPSPADDFKELRISLDNELVRNKESTFYARVSGDSMENAGLSDGDLLVIDRSLSPENKKIAVCYLEGEFTVKRIIKKKGSIYLKPENKNYKEIEIKDGDELIIWGIVTYVIKSLT